MKTSQLRSGELHLRAVDGVMKELVPRVGPCALGSRPRRPAFAALVDAIISQQISVHAAAAIRRRFVTLFGGRMPSARRLLLATDEELRTAGLSAQKVRYVQDLSARVASRRLRLGALESLEDDDVVGALAEVKGIGRWTAHIFMIFSLGRLDVLPVDDLGILDGARLLYGLHERPEAVAMTELAECWKPYRSIGSWYLWQGRRLELGERG